jgi:hypothetical protein
LKDIENSMPQAGAALTRLERALGRLEAAAKRGRATPPGNAVEGELARLKDEHAALKETAARVADRLDGTIARLAVVAEQGG